MVRQEKVLGVIGGLGPFATARFLELTAQVTQTRLEQEHLDMIVYNFPSIPDRTGYILGSNLKSPLPGLISVAKDLSRQGVDEIVIPCITAHYFYDTLQNAVPTPIIDGVAETVAAVKAAGVKNLGIMATEGTILSGFLAGALSRAGVHPILPSRAGQKDVNHLIYRNIKAGLPAEMDRFHAVHMELRAKGAEAILLGCTELSILRREEDLGKEFIDAMEVLARAAVRRCGKKQKGVA